MQSQLNLPYYRLFTKNLSIKHVLNKEEEVKCDKSSHSFGQ